MKGHVYRRGKTWSFRFDIDPDPLTGKRRQENGSGYKTESEAWKECRAAMADYEKGRVVSSSRHKVGGGPGGAMPWALGIWAWRCGFPGLVTVGSSWLGMPEAGVSCRVTAGSTGRRAGFPGAFAVFLLVRRACWRG